MGRRTAVEAHPQRDEIEQRLANGDSLNSLSKVYGITRGALANHKNTRLPEKLTIAVQKRTISSAQELFEVVLKSVRYMEKLADSCDDFLQDPDRPDMYNMGPRAHEINVVWEEFVETTDSGRDIYEKHRNTLQELLDKTVTGLDRVISINFKHTDPRVLIIKSAEGLTRNLEMLTQAWARIDQGKSSFVGTPAWTKVVRVILDSTNDYPEVRRKIANGLSSISS